MHTQRAFLPVRSRAPLRLGLAGGGTDLSPYCDMYGGSILNVTIDRFAYATIEPGDDRKVRFVAEDLGHEEVLDADVPFDCNQGLRLHRAVYNHFIRTCNQNRPIPMTLTTWIECPFGSGLGASSALVVALIGAFQRLLNVSSSKKETAALAYTLEREQLALSGGRQDQYSAAFGGLNYMEFCSDNKVIVTPLSVDMRTVNELEASLLLCFTGVSRSSSSIIDTQINAIRSNKARTMESMHILKKNALEMKLALMDDDLERLARLLHDGWQAKKQTAADISNNVIDDIYSQALDAGAWAGKISGAGGGGFMMLLADPVRKNRVLSLLQEKSYQVFNCHFTFSGLESWNFTETATRRKPAAGRAVS